MRHNPSRQPNIRSLFFVLCADFFIANRLNAASNHRFHKSHRRNCRRGYPRDESSRVQLLSAAGFSFSRFSRRAREPDRTLQRAVVPLFVCIWSRKVGEKNRGWTCRVVFPIFVETLAHHSCAVFFFSGISLALEIHSYRGTTTDLAFLIVNKLRIGAADYHLYFLVILTQCYLLYPLLSRISHAYPGGYRAATWLMLLLVAGLLYKGSSEFLLPKLGLSHPGWHASFVIYWLPYFMLGILHARRPAPAATSAVTVKMAPVTNYSPLWKSTAATAFVIFTLGLVVLEYVYYSRRGSPVDYYNHFSRPSVMLYALAVVSLLHGLPHPPVPPLHNVERGVDAKSEPALRHRLAPLSTLWRGAGGEVARLAPLTFSVYLIHPQVLRVLTNYAAGLPSVFMWLITVVVTFTLVYGLTLLTNKAAQKSPVWLTGPVQFLQRCLGLR